MKALFSLLILTLSLQACNYNTSKSSPTSVNSVTSTPDAVVNLAFAQAQTQVCLNCHKSGGQRPDLSSKAALISHGRDIMTELSDDSMPPVENGYTSFTACEKAALQKWYDLGSPDESDVKVNSLPECLTAGTTKPTEPTSPVEPPTPPVAPPTPPVVVTPTPPVTEEMIDFQYIKLQTKVCLDCHSPGKKKPDLSTQENLIQFGDDVLSEVLDDSMPPKKKGYASFTPCQKAALQKWYDLGAPEVSNTPVKSLPECMIN